MKEFREQIDKIDNEIIKKLFERMELSKDIAAYKTKHAMKIFDEKREQEIIEKRYLYLKELGVDDKRFVEELFEKIISKSKDIQQKKIEELER